MNILQINLIYRNKSTGRTCLQLDEYFNSCGHHSITAFGWGKKDANAYRINNYFEYYFHNIMSRITGLEGYFSFLPTIRLIRFIKKQKIEVIILHSLHGHYLNMPLFFNFVKKHKIKIVMHLHDCYMFTGKCTYYSAVHCEKWLSTCSHCPMKKAYPKSLFFDASRFLQKKKQKWFSDLDCKIIGNSNWTSGEAKKSKLSTYPIFTVNNWIDLSIFRPKEDNKDIEILPKDKFIILAVSVDWTPNTPRYNDLLKLSKLIDNNYHIFMVGKCNSPINSNNITLIEYMDNVQKLVDLYSAADCFVHFSIEDSFGKVIAEAQACGTPAIVYNSTACKDVVQNNITGYVAEPRNVNQVYEYIKAIKKNTKKYYSNNCREWAEKNFNKAINCQKFLDIVTGSNYE